MPRKIFIPIPDAFFHISNRCHNKDWFDLDMELVWKIFSENLYFTSYCFGLKIHAFVLMSNHYHLLVSDPEGNISAAMAYFQKLCTDEINRIRGTQNQLWGGRFHRSLIDSDRYFHHCLKYIYRNPVEAKICQNVENYPWSSLQFVLGKQPFAFPVFDDLIDPITATKELKWLNTKPSAENLDSIRRALRKSQFKLPLKNNRQNNLEWEVF